MKVRVEHNGTHYEADLGKGIDLSIAVKQGETVNAYHAPPVKMEPFRTGSWVGSVALGGSVNYRNIFFNPHGHGTHTECFGHIAETIYSVNSCFSDHHMLAQLITIRPQQQADGDQVITAAQIGSCPMLGTDALILRTLPNDDSKRYRHYSGTNPPYLEAEAVKLLVANGCRHLVLDLPSIDRESDQGRLLGHKAFWNYPDRPRKDCTVTELAYVPSAVADGLYLLNLQVAPFENDAAPSRPLIFPLSQIR